MQRQHVNRCTRVKLLRAGLFTTENQMWPSDRFFRASVWNKRLNLVRSSASAGRRTRSISPSSSSTASQRSHKNHVLLSLWISWTWNKRHTTIYRKWTQRAVLKVNMELFEDSCQTFWLNVFTYIIQQPKLMFNFINKGLLNINREFVCVTISLRMNHSVSNARSYEKFRTWRWILTECLLYHLIFG